MFAVVAFFFELEILDEKWHIERRKILEVSTVDT
jgi:hypothetical protein